MLRRLPDRWEKALATFDQKIDAIIDRGVKKVVAAMEQDKRKQKKLLLPKKPSPTDRAIVECFVEWLRENGYFPIGKDPDQLLLEYFGPPKERKKK